MNKARVGRKTEIGNLGKNAKVGSSFPTGGRLLGVSTSKASSAPSYKTAQPHKSSARFGVIWIPRRKVNKYHTDKVYNPNKNDYSRGDRSPSMYKFMSGDSSNHETQLKNKDDETLLAPEHSGHREWASAGAVAELSGLPTPLGKRRGNLLHPDKEDDQQSTNDMDNKSIGSETGTGKDTTSEGESKDKLEDKVDSVWLRAPSPHKRAPSASSPSDEGCGLTCLYYTLQCCDCILM